MSALIECSACEGHREFLDDDEDTDGRKAFVVKQCRNCLGVGDVEPEPDTDYVVRRDDTIVWRGDARGCVHALDLARAARPELQDVDLNVTSPKESV